ALSSTLNILGLGMAYAAFVIIMIQVNYEKSFDKSYPNSERIFRMEVSTDLTGQVFGLPLSRPLFDAVVNGIPQIEYGTIIDLAASSVYLTVDRGTSKDGFKECVTPVYSDYAKVFGMQFIEGGFGDISLNTKVIIPLSMAQKMFGPNGPYVGKLIMMEQNKRGKGPTSIEIEGVYQDFPANSSQANIIYTHMTDRDTDNVTEWGNWNYTAYLTLSSAADKVQVSQALNQKLRALSGYGSTVPLAIRLTPIEQIYYIEGVAYDNIAAKGKRATTNILIAIAFLVIFIGAINFVNFATSLTPLRIRSINTQKVLGSQNWLLRVTLVFEAVGISFCAFLCGVFFVGLLDEVGFSSLMLTSVAVLSNIPIIALTGLIALVIGGVSGLYPAFYSTSFVPALVLKGNFGMSPRGRALRMVLVGFQFIISTGLIIGAIFLQLQNRYMRNYDLGYSMEQVAMVQLNRDMAKKENKSTIVSRLMSNPMIKDVAFAQTPIGTQDFYMNWGREINGGNIHFDCIPVSYNFCQVMGIDIVQGRDFQANDALIYGGRMIFNQQAQKKAPIQVGTSVWAYDTLAQVVGIARDFNYKSLRFDIEPIALYVVDNGQNLDVAYIKIVGDPYSAQQHIKSVFASVDPQYPIGIQFADTTFNTLYERERKTTTIITIFSLLSVLISLFGVFGIVVFETQYRRREIGLRKVYGSTVGQILAMFSARFVWMVLVCFVLAAPLAYIGVDLWLESFAYRTPIHWWVFLVALLIVLFITLATVIIQSYRSATENPVKSLKK
ncbi:MAG: FtsX-like permease family protein, partial [Mucinivorans sp.]